MEVYVIKRDDGKYWCGFDGFIGQHIFSDRIFDGLNTQKPTYKHCLEEIVDYNLENCRVVLATIFEGTLEQHDEEIKKQEREKILNKLEEIPDALKQLRQEDKNND